jgi:hypothetical protein
MPTRITDSASANPDRMIANFVDAVTRLVCKKCAGNAGATAKVLGRSRCPLYHRPTEFDSGTHLAHEAEPGDESAGVPGELTLIDANQ